MSYWDLEISDSIGNRYGFQVFPLSMDFPAVPGIYMFVKPSINRSTNKWDILYIGETDSFSRRIDKQLSIHHKYTDILKEGVMHTAILTLNNWTEEQRKALEKELISFHCPLWNEKV